MLVLIDAVGFAVLLPGQNAAVPPREVAVVSGAHVALLTVEARLPVLQAGSLARGKLTAFYALRDPVLLVFLPLVDVVRRRLSDQGKRGERKRGSESKAEKFHVESPVLLSLRFGAAAEAYGRNEPRLSEPVAAYRKTIFLAQGATFRELAVCLAVRKKASRHGI